MDDKQHAAHHQAIEREAVAQYVDTTGDDQSLHVQHHHHHHHIEQAPFPWSKYLTLGGAALTTGIVLAPHVLPALGIGEGLEPEIAAFCRTAEGTGISGLVAGGLSHVPYFGEALAQGGLTNVIGAAAIGFAGMWAGHKLQDQYTGKGINWGKIIHHVALATSALIALPAILPAIGMGLTFLSFLMPGVDKNLIGGLIQSTLGTVGGEQNLATAGSGISALLVPHLLSCGVALGSAGGMAWMHKEHGEQAKDGHTAHGPVESDFMASDGFAASIRAEQAQAMPSGFARA